MPPEQSATSAPQLATTWDVPIRLFHWLLVGLLGFSWWSGEQHEMEWHRYSGYAILALLIFRIYWGFVGSRTARFAQFVRGPRAAFAYARSIGKRSHVAAPGHNPIGGWSVIIMLASLAVMVVAGLFAIDVDGLESGPLADYVSFDQGRLAATVHHFMFNILLAVVAIHVLAILFYLVGLRHNLITPMISGRGRFPAQEEAKEGSGASWKAAVGIIIALACTYAIAQGFRI
ncbi:MAG: cytochrome b/b6 domain-containing protein [Sphingobium sp.]